MVSHQSCFDSALSLAVRIFYLFYYFRDCSTLHLAYLLYESDFLVLSTSSFLYSSICVVIWVPNSILCLSFSIWFLLFPYNFLSRDFDRLFLVQLAELIVLLGSVCAHGWERRLSIGSSPVFSFSVYSLIFSQAAVFYCFVRGVKLDSTYQFLLIEAY